MSGKYWRWSLVGAAILGVAATWAVGSLLTRSTNSPVKASASPAEDIVLKSTGDIRLAATYWPTPSNTAPAILLLHGNGSNRGSMAATGAWLNAQGYSVLAIDFRGHGQSTPAPKSFGLAEAEDAHAAFDWLRTNHPHSRIGIIGFSLGGAASLLGDKGPLPADALVLEGVYPDIRRAIYNRLKTRLGSLIATAVEPLLSFQSLPRLGVWPSQIAPLRALYSVTIPVMIVGGGDDTNTPPNETREMFDAVKNHGELIIVEGMSHDQLGRETPPLLASRLLAFLDRNLRG
jgi:alpha-beta hydrolase superfamily lysophospholipase